MAIVTSGFYLRPLLLASEDFYNSSPLHGTLNFPLCINSFLGVLIDENLTWSNHINAITKKISSGIRSIKRISHCVPPATLHTIYHGLVQSHFDYCSVVWGNCAKNIS